MAVTIIKTAAINTPVSVQELRDYGRIDDDNDADILLRNIATATFLCENQIGRSFITKAFTISTDESTGIPINHIPLIDVIAIRDLRVGETGRTVFHTYDVSGDSPLYTISTTTASPTLNLSSTIIDQEQVFEIDYTAGYGEDADDVPSELKEAVLSTALNLYEGRGKMVMSPNAIPTMTLKILQQFRTFNSVI